MYRSRANEKESVETIPFYDPDGKAIQKVGRPVEQQMMPKGMGSSPKKSSAFNKPPANAFMLFSRHSGSRLHLAGIFFDPDPP